MKVHTEDAGRFLRRSTGTYDVILMSVGDPINAQMNRFYTESSRPDRPTASTWRRDRGLLFSGEGELVPLKTTMAAAAGDLEALEPSVD